MKLLDSFMHIPVVSDLVKEGKEYVEDQVKDKINEVETKFGPEDHNWLALSFGCYSYN